ncbi:MAG: hypothetical protein FWG74_04220, partial [Planctomycetes bacterium]|nr:hypothetical protein [Planctomycetota bacterium]
MMKTDKNRPELNGHPRPWLKIWLAVLTLAVALGFGLIFHLYSHRGPAASLAPSPAAPALDAAQAPAGQAPPGLPAFTDADQNPLSPREAFERLLASAEAGSAPAMLNLAEFYGNGWGVRQNLTERYQWLEKAAEAGDPQGAFRAGLALEMGLGVAADQAAAARAFERAAA